MKAYTTLVTTRIRSLMREPVDVFFSLLFAPGLVLILGLVFNRLPENPFGQNYVETVATATPTLVLAITAVIMVPLRFSNLRTSGALRRLRLTPLKASTFVAADLTVNFIIGYIGILLAYMVCWVFFRVAVPANLLAVLGITAFGLLAFLALGYALAMLYPSPRAADGIGNALMILLVLSSGMTIPISILPERERTILQMSPTFQFSDMVSYVWHGQSQLDPWIPFTVMGAMLVIFGLMAIWRFNWDQY